MVAILSPVFDFITFPSYNFMSETDLKEEFYALLFAHNSSSWAIPYLFDCGKNIYSEKNYMKIQKNWILFSNNLQISVIYYFLNPSIHLWPAMQSFPIRIFLIELQP